MSPGRFEILFAHFPQDLAGALSLSPDETKPRRPPALPALPPPASGLVLSFRRAEIAQEVPMRIKDRVHHEKSSQRRSGSPVRAVSCGRG